MMVLLFYINNIDLQYEFKTRGFSLISLEESTSEFKKRNREIGNFICILEEVIRFYGISSNLFISSGIFYHSISLKLHLYNLILFVDTPILLTIEPSAAMIICNNINNSVLQLKAYDQTSLLFDCSWLSTSPYNYEYLTTSTSYNITDIINNYQSNEVFLNTILLFKYLISGNYIENLLHLKQLHQYILLGLMSNMSEGYKKHSNIPYYMQLLFQYIVNKIILTNSLWIIKSQFEKLGDDLRTCFFDIDEDENIQSGPFYEYLQLLTKNNIRINLTQEYEWNIIKQDDILKFWSLNKNEYMEGPQLNYYISANNEQDDDNNKQRRNTASTILTSTTHTSTEESFIAFVPIIKKSHINYNNNISIGIKLIQLPDNINNIKLQYNILEKNIKYTCKNIKIYNNNNKQINETIIFDINQIKIKSSLLFQISLRIISVE